MHYESFDQEIKTVNFEKNVVTWRISLSCKLSPVSKFFVIWAVYFSYMILLG